jgi:hypothetical protein
MNNDMALVNFPHPCPDTGSLQSVRGGDSVPVSQLSRTHQRTLSTAGTRIFPRQLPLHRLGHPRRQWLGLHQPPPSAAWSFRSPVRYDRSAPFLRVGSTYVANLPVSLWPVSSGYAFHLQHSVVDPDAARFDFQQLPRIRFRVGGVAFR